MDGFIQKTLGQLLQFIANKIAGIDAKIWQRIGKQFKSDFIVHILQHVIQKCSSDFGVHFFAIILLRRSVYNEFNNRYGCLELATIIQYMQYGWQ